MKVITLTKTSADTVVTSTNAGGPGAPYQKPCRKFAIYSTDVDGDRRDDLLLISATKLTELISRATVRSRPVSPKIGRTPRSLRAGGLRRRRSQRCRLHRSSECQQQRYQALDCALDARWQLAALVGRARRARCIVEHQPSDRRRRLQRRRARQSHDCVESRSNMDVVCGHVRRRRQLFVEQSVNAMGGGSTHLRAQHERCGRRRQERRGAREPEREWIQCDLHRVVCEGCNRTLSPDPGWRRCIAHVRLPGDFDGDGRADLLLEANQSWARGREMGNSIRRTRRPRCRIARHPIPRDLEPGG